MTGISKKVPNNSLNKAAEALSHSVTRKWQISLGRSMQTVTVKAAQQIAFLHGSYYRTLKYCNSL